MKRLFKKLIEFLRERNPFKRKYSKMINDICDEVENEKILSIFLNVPQEKRDDLFLEIVEKIIEKYN